MRMRFPSLKTFTKRQTYEMGKPIRLQKIRGWNNRGSFCMFWAFVEMPKKGDSNF